MTAELRPAWPGTGRDAAPPLRASHADRDLAVDILRVAMGDGRLTVAELDERLEAALTARTVGELAALTADLPGGAAFQAAVSQDTRADSDRLAAGRWEFLRSLLNELVRS